MTNHEPKHPPADMAGLDGLIERLGELLDQFDQGCADIGGCSDGGCVIQRPKGQHTNGGCRCSDDRIRMRRFAQRAAYFREKVRAEINAPEAATQLQALAARVKVLEAENERLRGHLASIIADPDCCAASKAVARAALGDTQ